MADNRTYSEVPKKISVENKKEQICDKARQIMRILEWYVASGNREKKQSQVHGGTV